MKNISKADERLKTAAGFVRQGSRLLDIGTDHAHLPVYLIKNGVCPCAVAADIVPGPLMAAKKTVREKGLEKEIKLFLSDGFDSVPENCADDVVIAGMGGELIVQILSRCEWIKNGNIRLILQPMTHPEAVRQFLYDNGFYIIGEEACISENRPYCVIAAEYSGSKFDYDAADCYIGNLPECEKDRQAVHAFLTKQYERICKRRDALKKIGECGQEYSELLYISNKMERYL